MKDTLQTLFSGIIAAWEMLLDVPIPGIIRQYSRSARVTPVVLAAGFTSVGVLTGLCFALLGGLLNISWINHYAAGAIFAVAAVILCELLDSGRGLRLLVSAITKRIGGSGWSESVLKARDRDGSFEKSSGCIAAMIVILIETLCFGMLAYYRATLWCVAVFAGAFTIQMLFATLERSYGNPPFIIIAPEKMRLVWLLPIIIGILTILFFPAAGIAAAVLVGVLGQMIHKNFVLTGTPVTADVITLCGKIAQIILLICGIIFVI